MVDHELLQIASNLLKHKSWEVREQSGLLLSNFALSSRAREIYSYAFPKLKELLEDKVLKVRETAAVCF